MNSLKNLFIAIENDYRKEYGSELRIQSSKQSGGGCINEAMQLQTNRGKFFLKWNSNSPNDLFLRESESLNELHQSNNEFLIFPKPLLSKPIDQIPGYLLTTYLEPGRCGNDDEKLGRGLAQLHRFTSDKFGFYHNNYCGATLQNNSFKPDWITFYVDNRIGYLIDLIANTRGWSAEDHACTNLFLKRVPELLAHAPLPSLIHGDLWSGNYMYTQSSPALIDPCVSFCDREFELGIMSMFGGFSPRVYDAYNEYFPLPTGWRNRNLVYQLYHVLNHYYLFGGYYKQQAMDIMKSYC